MYETVTVDAAFRIAKRKIEYPSWCIFVLSLSGFAWDFVSRIHPAWVPFAIFLGGLMLVFLYRGIGLGKWHIWALENVRNVHELQDRAHLEGFLNTDYGLNAIYLPSDRKKLLDLSRKFDKPDVFEDDVSIPDQFIIRYSKMSHLSTMVILLLIAIIAVYLGVPSWGFNSTKVSVTSLVVPALIAFPCMIGAVWNYKRACNDSPQLILDKKGLYTPKTGFIAWEVIQEPRVIGKTQGKYNSYYLWYIYADSQIEVPINSYNCTPKQLDELLRIYRGRYEQQKNR